MKKRTPKLLALLLSMSMLGTAGIGAVPVSAAQGTSAGLTIQNEVSYIDDFTKIGTITNAGKESVTNAPGKPAGDTVLKITPNESTTNSYTQKSIINAGTQTCTVSFEIYPTQNITSIGITVRPGSAQPLFSSVPVKSNQWNRVIYTYVHGTGSTLYVNDEKYGTSTYQIPTAYQTSIPFRVVTNYSTTEDTVYYIDEYQHAYGTAVIPPALSGKYIIENNFIHEYGTDTVGNVLDNITYNGTSVTIKNTSGEDITESTSTKISEGDSLYVYDGDIITGHYYFGDSHKKLVALSDTSGVAMASGFDDGTINGFTVLGSAAVDIEAVSGTDYGKPADDMVLSISNTDTALSSYNISRSTNAADRGKVSTISFEVYPDGSWNRLNISTDSGSHFARIPADRFKANEWNQLTLFIGGNKTVRDNTVYINGKQVTGETSDSTDASKLYIWNGLAMKTTLRIGTSFNEGEISNLLIDNFYYAEGQALMPPMTTEAYIVDGMSVSEYAQDTVGSVLSNITYNGSQAVIKNSNGTDITASEDTAVTQGNHLYIYDGDFITGHYTFKTAHTTPVVNHSYIDNFDGISVTNGEYITETSVSGKPESDTSMKLMADTSTANADTNIGTVYLTMSLMDSETASVPLSTVSFEVYPNDTINEIVIAGRANLPNYELTFRKIPVSDLAAGQWNKILFVYNTTGKNKVYLNGNLYSSEDSGHFGSSLTYGGVRIKANYTKTDGVTPYVYIDEYQDAYGKPVMPPMTTEVYDVEGNTINGCSDTAADVKENIEIAFGAEAVLKNAEGAEMGDSDTIVSGCSLYIYDGELISGHYYTEAGKLTVNTPVITNSGLNTGDTAEASVTYTVTDGTARDLYLFLASYNAEGELTGVKVRQINIGADDRGTYTAATDLLTLTEAASAIRAYVMDAGLIPLCEPGYV